MDNLNANKIQNYSRGGGSYEKLIGLMSPFPHFAVSTSHILISANKGVFDAGFEIEKKVVGSTLMLLDPWIIPPAPESF